MKTAPGSQTCNTEVGQGGLSVGRGESDGEEGMTAE